MTTDLSRPLEQLPDPLAVPTLTSRRGKPAFDVAVRPPGSKSLTNRALLLAALAKGTSRIRRPLVDADDAHRMLAAIASLGASVETAPTGDIQISGVGGRWRVPPSGLTLDLANAGTATRFLAAAALLSSAPVTIDGNARMRERPIAELIRVLESLGARAEYTGKRGCPPVRITPPTSIPGAKTLDIPSTQSSQFISALLLIAPWFPLGLTIRLHGEVTSPTYISMTIGLLHRLGARVQSTEDLRVIRVGPPRDEAAPAETVGLAPFTYDVEPDASGATYFWAAASLFPGARCAIIGLDDSSLQGDTSFPGLLVRMGATLRRTGTDADPAIQVRGPELLSPILADMTTMPDAAMTLAAVACFAPGTSILRGLGTLRVKETDRIAAMVNELTKLGVQVVTPVAGDEDALTITPPVGGLDCSADAPRVEFDTYDDHRMAMSLALIGLRRPNVFIRNPGCVAKTYPGFWNDLARLTGAATT